MDKLVPEYHHHAHNTNFITWLFADKKNVCKHNASWQMSSFCVKHTIQTDSNSVWRSSYHHKVSLDIIQLKDNWNAIKRKQRTRWMCGIGMVAARCDAVKMNRRNVRNIERRQQLTGCRFLPTNPQQNAACLHLMLLPAWITLSIQYFDAVGWWTGRASSLYKSAIPKSSSLMDLCRHGQKIQILGQLNKNQ